MQLQPPSWELANVRCSCCDGQGELIFSTCPTCGLVVLICAEVGTVFEISDRHVGRLLGGSFHSERNTCINCGKSKYSEFKSATSDEILARGLRPEDYR